MSRRNKIIYWIATVWLSLGMVSTGVVQISGMQQELDKMTELGYPFYLLTILAIWKFLGVIVVLLPRLPLVKEWAYAGFFFAMSGAIISHIVRASEPIELFGPSLLLVLTVVSWYFRLESRKVSTTI
ncbi:MAG: DoxX family protein [Saprospiraceae bacterium]